MGNTYTRQSSYSDGDVITAAHTNDEFNQLLAAFASGTGHTHDGTTAEGGPITKLLGTSLTFGDGTAGTDITITFDGETSDGVLKWMEDEDYFEFSDDILVASTEKLQFRDTAIYINSSTDGQLDLVADTEIQIAATTIDMNGALDLSGNLTVGGNIIIGSANISETELEVLDGLTVTTAEVNVLDGITSTVGELNLVDGSSAGTIVNSKAVIYSSGGKVNATSLQIAGTDLTATATEFNLLDGGSSIGTTTVSDGHGILMNHGGTMQQTTVQTLAAYLDDEITAMPNLVTTGALNSGSITSGFGTIDTGSSTITTTGLITGGSLDIDDVLINGSNIGHTDDTDLITVANGLVTVAGEISVTTLDIGGTNVTSTAGELNILDGVTASTAELNILDGVTASAADINLIDGITNGTVIASKAIITDANKDISGGRNITISGELDAATLDISGDADIDGTANLDDTDIDGTLVVDGSNISLDSTSTLNIDNSNTSNGITIGTATSGVPISIGHSTSEVTVNDNLTVTGDLTVSGTTTTVNSTTVNLNDHNIVLDSGNSTSAVINGAGITLEGGTGTDATFAYSTTGPKFEIKLGSDYEDLQVDQLIAASLDISGNIDVDGTTNLDVVDIDGAVDMASTLTVAGVVDITDTTDSSDATGDTGALRVEGGASIAKKLFVGTDADIDGTLEADAITVNGTALNTVIAGVTVTNATTAAVATTVTISDNESTNEDNAIIFTSGGDVDGGNIGLESDGDLTYNPSTGTVTATIFKGNIDAVDGDFDGTLEADAITVNGTALNTVIADEATALAIALG
jgi:hypothetical protein